MVYPRSDTAVLNVLSVSRSIRQQWTYLVIESYKCCFLITRTDSAIVRRLQIAEYCSGQNVSQPRFPPASGRFLVVVGVGVRVKAIWVWLRIPPYRQLFWKQTRTTLPLHIFTIKASQLIIRFEIDSIGTFSSLKLACGFGKQLIN